MKNKEDGRPIYLNNVVLRPELTLNMKSYLPENQNVILIGDIYNSEKLKMLEVKGIEFIDASMSSPNDIVVSETVCNSFERGIWSINNVNWNDTFFTPDKIYELIQSCFTVKEPDNVRKIYEEWNKYIKFRNYYLNEQSKRNFKLDSVEFLNSYAVNNKDYRKNKVIYDDYILDDVEVFKSGDMVILSKKVEDAEPFPLVRLNIDRNKKQYNEKKVNIKGKLVNEEERNLRSLAKDNVFITAIDPQSNSKFKTRTDEIQKVQLSELLNEGYTLGDRFKVVSFDIIPQDHLKQLDDEYNSDIDIKYKEIDQKYEKIVEDELYIAKEDFDKNIALEIEKKIKDKKIILENQLKADVEANNDLEVLTKIEEFKNNIKKEIYFSNIKCKNESNKEYQKRLNILCNEAYKDINIKQFLLIMVYLLKLCLNINLFR